MKKILFFLTVLTGVGVTHAQQFSYEPINPAFGGRNYFNYNWLLSSANAQNGFKEPEKGTGEKSNLERFGENLNSQILSQISRSLLQQQLQSVGNFDQEGTFTFGTLNVEVFESPEGLVINILDTSNGEQTQVVVPN